jgi:transposase
MFMLKSNLKQLHSGHAKRSILDQAEAGRDEAAIGVLLRCEGLYSSPLTTWRRQREQAERETLAPKKRGCKSTANPLTEEVQRLRADNARLSRRLEPAELIIDVQTRRPCGRRASRSNTNFMRAGVSKSCTNSELSKEVNL